MTDDSRFLDLLGDVLADPPTTAPDRLLASVLDGVRTGPQRGRGLFGIGRGLDRSLRRLAPIALIGAIVVAVTVIQSSTRPAVLAPRPTGSPSVAPASPSPVPSPDSVKYAESYAIMSPGRYEMPEPNTDGFGDWPVDRVIVTVPEGWVQWGPARGGGILKGTGSEDELARLTFGRLGALDCPSPALPPGETVDELVASLGALPDVKVTDVAIGAYRGKRVEFTVAGSQGACRWPSGWATPSGGERWHYIWSVGWRHQLSILDIAGVRFVIDASITLAAPPNVAAELGAIVDSIEFEGQRAPR